MKTENIIILGSLGLLFLASNLKASNNSNVMQKPVFPLKDPKRYYLPPSLGGTGYWSPYWNFGTERGRWHYGLDLLPLSTPVIPKDLEKHPVLAYANGKVIEAYTNDTYGDIVKIQHPNGFKTRYLHMYSRTVKPGDYVNAGDVIGLVGWKGSNPNTISSSHLHFEIYNPEGTPVNPTTYLKPTLL